MAEQDHPHPGHLPRDAQHRGSRPCFADRIIVLGRNPGKVRTDFKVTLAHPRDRKAPAFTQLVDYIYKVLTQPDAKPPELPNQTPAERQARERQAHYQMLPHARPGGIAGLLEILLDHNGKDDIFRLADDLSFEIDDLLPIVDAANLLGFLKVNEGDAEITPLGLEYANSEIVRQKEVFRAAAVGNKILLLRQIVRAVEVEEPTAASPKTSSTTCSTSSSARKRPSTSSKPPSAGADTRSCSTSTPPAAASRNLSD